MYMCGMFYGRSQKKLFIMARLIFYYPHHNWNDYDFYMFHFLMSNINYLYTVYLKCGTWFNIKFINKKN